MKKIFYEEDSNQAYYNVRFPVTRRCVVFKSQDTKVVFSNDDDPSGLPDRSNAARSAQVNDSSDMSIYDDIV